LNELSSLCELFVVHLISREVAPPARLSTSLQLKKENVERQSVKMVTSAIGNFLTNAASGCNGKVRHTEIFIARLPGERQQVQFSSQ
jgi:hypothetical protein